MTRSLLPCEPIESVASPAGFFVYIVKCSNASKFVVTASSFFVCVIQEHPRKVFSPLWMPSLLLLVSHDTPDIRQSFLDRDIEDHQQPWHPQPTP
jgi:hypothetical protein